MPIIRVELLPGRTQEQKTLYATEATRLTAEILKCPVESVDVIFTEIEPRDWAREGRMHSPASD